MSKQSGFSRALIVIIIFIVIVAGYFTKWYFGKWLDNKIINKSNTVLENDLFKELNRINWADYIDSNKKDLVLRFNLTEHQKNYCDISNIENLDKCYNVEDGNFNFPRSLPSVEEENKYTLFNNKIYFIVAGMAGFEWSEEYVIGTYDLGNNNFSILGNELGGGDGELFHFSTSAGDYLVVFSRETGSGAGLITKINIYNSKEQELAKAKNREQTMFDRVKDIKKEINDKELIDKIISIIRESRGDFQVKNIVLLPETDDKGCGEWSKYDRPLKIKENYTLRYNFDSFVDIKTPIKTDIFLRKIKGIDDYEDMPILVNDAVTNIGENQYQMSIPQEYENKKERYYVIIRLNHQIDFYGDINYEKEKIGKGKFIEFESDIICIRSSGKNSSSVGDLLTYKNDKYGFEFKYPSDWGFPNVFPAERSNFYEGKSYIIGESFLYSDYGYDAKIGFNNEVELTIVNINSSTGKRVYANTCSRFVDTEKDTLCDDQDYKDYTLAEDAQRLKNLPDIILSKWYSGDIVELKTLNPNKLRVVSFPADTINNNPGRSYKFYGKDFAYEFYFPPTISDAESVLSTIKFTK